LSRCRFAGLEDLKKGAGKDSGPASSGIKVIGISTVKERWKYLLV